MSLAETSSYQIEDIGPLYSLVLGSPMSGRITNAHREQSIALCAASFESFTFIKSEGYFKGVREESLLFQVATKEQGKVIKLAAQMAEVFDQEGVGIVQSVSPGASYMGYSRVIPNRPRVAI